MLEQLLERLDKKLETLDERLDSVDKTLIKQEQNLGEHMRRTEILEQQHSLMSDRFNKDLQPLTAHVAQVKGISKFVGFLITVCATGAAVYSLV